MQRHFLAFILGLATFVIFLPSSLCAGKADGRLDVYWVDVEGGGATLIVTPTGESVLIDTGNPGGRDAGRIHKAATELAGLSRIDHLVVTHFHIDHFGGAAELAALMPVGTVWDKGLPDTNPDNNPADTRWPLLSKPYRNLKADQRRVLKAGDTIPLRAPANGTPLSLRCMAAQQQYVEAGPGAAKTAQCGEVPSKPKDTSDNANSVVLVLEFGPFRFFDGGDLTWNTELGLVCPVDRVGEVDVYQVNHHGLNQSNHPLLVRSLAPTVSVMNNGPRKGTDPETMVTLRSVPTIQAMYQVHRNLRDEKDGNTDEALIANLEEKCAGHPVMMSVEPTGKRYAIRIPSRGHERAFETRLNKRLSAGQ